MDVASVVSTAVTGAVGVAGIAGSIVSARIASRSAEKTQQLSISAEDKRAGLAEKRRVYAALLTTMGTYVGARMRGNKAETALAEAAAVSAGFEVQLIAPSELGDDAISVLRMAEKIDVTSEAVDQAFVVAVKKLTSSMRDDLGGAW